MLEGKSEKLEFQKMSSSPHWKTKMSKNKTKILEKRNQEKWRIKEKWWKERKMNEKIMKSDLSWNDPWLRSPWNTIWACLSFLSNHEPWPTLRTWKVHFDWTWILGLKSFFLEKIFVINRLLSLFLSQQKNLDQSFTCLGWILNCQVHNRTVKKMIKKMKMERENKDSRVKTRKDRKKNERNFEDSWAERTKEWKAMIGQHLNPL